MFCEFASCHKIVVSPKIVLKVVLTSSVNLGPGFVACRCLSHKLGGRLPLLLARPALTFPALGHHRLHASVNLFCLMTEAHRFE